MIDSTTIPASGQVVVFFLFGYYGKPGVQVGGGPRGQPGERECCPNEDGIVFGQGVWAEVAGTAVRARMRAERTGRVFQGPTSWPRRSRTAGHDVRLWFSSTLPTGTRESEDQVSSGIRRFPAGSRGGASRLKDVRKTNSATSAYGTVRWRYSGVRGFVVVKVMVPLPVL